METNKRVTAVEWLVSILNKEGFAQVLTDEELDQAKAMEKQQIEGAYKVGYNDCSLGRFSDCEKYYTSTYGK
jgi:hypothetical protein